MELMLDIIKKNDIKYIQMEIEDLNGVSRCSIYDIDYFLKHISLGFEYCKSTSVFTANGEYAPGTGLQEEIDFLNGYVYPDISTFKVLPWEKHTASVLVDFLAEPLNMNSSFHPISPRGICKKQIERLKIRGLKIYGAFEYEFYLLDKNTKMPVFSETNLNSTRLTNIVTETVYDIMENMKSIGIKPECFHIEYGPGQLELTNTPYFGIMCADNAFRFKALTKGISLKHGYTATFMSKPFANSSGSSGHFNHSIWNEEGKNMFYDKEQSSSFSKLAQHWLAGLRYHSDALMSFNCPTPNCYMRIMPGVLVPTNNSWGFEKRTVAYRVKKIDMSRTYVENRIAGGSANPYLVLAATIIAGLDGIDRKLEFDMAPLKDDSMLTKARTDDVKTLPKSLEEALECLISNETFARELSPEFIQCFNAIKSYEVMKAKDVEESTDTDMWRWYRNTYMNDI